MAGLIPDKNQWTSLVISRAPGAFVHNLRVRYVSNCRCIAFWGYGVTDRHKKPNLARPDETRRYDVIRHFLFTFSPERYAPEKPERPRQ